ncbi:hypothetical protein M5D96_012460, partial [Drosophila gunungcola]
MPRQPPIGPDQPIKSTVKKKYSTFFLANIYVLFSS